MGTRCITEIRSRWSNEKDYETHAVIYRHWDGYLGGQGQYLYEFLKSVKVVNGITSDMPKKYANGPGRLAAMLVKEMNDDGLDPDLMPDNGPCGQEYHYVVNVDFGMNGGTVNIDVFDGPMTAFGAGGEDCNNLIFTGSIEEYGKFLES